jgi:hypothetical protein
MADRYRTPGGWTVEVVQLAAGERLRIRHHGYYVADVGNADDLARWIPADELVQLERDALMASMSLEEMLAIGSVITAMPIVNAIPAVIAARPGIVTYADLQTQASPAGRCAGTGPARLPRAQPR